MKWVPTPSEATDPPGTVANESVISQRTLICSPTPSTLSSHSGAAPPSAAVDTRSRREPFPSVPETGQQNPLNALRAQRVLCFADLYLPVQNVILQLILLTCDQSFSVTGVHVHAPGDRKSN